MADHRPRPPGRTSTVVVTSTSYTKAVAALHDLTDTEKLIIDVKERLGANMWQCVLRQLHQGCAPSLTLLHFLGPPLGFRSEKLTFPERMFYGGPPRHLHTLHLSHLRIKPNPSMLFHFGLSKLVLVDCHAWYTVEEMKNTMASLPALEELHLDHSSPRRDTPCAGRSWSLPPTLKDLILADDQKNVTFALQHFSWPSNASLDLEVRKTSGQPIRGRTVHNCKRLLASVLASFNDSRDSYKTASVKVLGTSVSDGPGHDIILEAKDAYNTQHQDMIPALPRSLKIAFRGPVMNTPTVVRTISTITGTLPLTWTRTLSVDLDVELPLIPGELTHARLWSAIFNRMAHLSHLTIQNPYTFTNLATCLATYPRTPLTRLTLQNIDFGEPGLLPIDQLLAINDGVVASFTTATVDQRKEPATIRLEACRVPPGIRNWIAQRHPDRYGSQHVVWEYESCVFH